MKRLVAISVGTLALICALLAYNELGGDFIQYDYYYVAFVPYLALVLFSPLAFVGEISTSKHNIFEQRHFFYVPPLLFR